MTISIELIHLMCNIHHEENKKNKKASNNQMRNKMQYISLNLVFYTFSVFVKNI